VRIYKDKKGWQVDRRYVRKSSFSLTIENKGNNFNDRRKYHEGVR
jgi:hypothetical protein